MINRQLSLLLLVYPTKPVIRPLGLSFSFPAIGRTSTKKFGNNHYSNNAIEPPPPPTHPSKLQRPTPYVWYNTVNPKRCERASSNGSSTTVVSMLTRERRFRNRNCGGVRARATGSSSRPSRACWRHCGVLPLAPCARRLGGRASLIFLSPAKEQSVPSGWALNSNTKNGTRDCDVGYWLAN